MYEYNCKIVRVVDGDTVDVDIDLGFGVVFANQRVRLYGIDAPESRTRDLVEKKFGLYAKEFLKKRLGKSCTLRTRLDGKGKFGRILGEFIVDGVNVNEEMVDKNMVVRYYGQSKDDIQSEHHKNFNILIENGLVE
jgi:micrococcal nuclease